jgi:hypothetical protein
MAGDDKPDTLAIQKALDDAIAGGIPTVIEFDKGVYRLDRSNGRTALTIDRAANLILDGKGCEFLILDPTMQLMGMRRSQRVILKNFSVDFDVLPHTQGWVTAVDKEAGTLTVRLDPAYPDLDQPHFRKAEYKWGFIKDRNDPVAFKEGTEFRIYMTGWSRTTSSNGTATSRSAPSTPTRSTTTFRPTCSSAAIPFDWPAGGQSGPPRLLSTG